jgi:NADH-quinone oxidoreductase subunit M
MFERVMHGPVANERVQGLRDMNAREIGIFIPIVILMFWLGIHPSTFMRKMDASISSYLHLIKSKQKGYALSEPPRPLSVPGRSGEAPPR